MEGFRQHFEGFKRWDGCQVGPLTPTTLSDNIDSSTCPGRLSPLVWDPPVMIYAFLKYLGLPINQVSHSGPPVPLSPLPSIILPPSCSQTVLPLFPIILYINLPTIIPFAHPLLPNCILPFPAPSPSIFRFFWDYLWLPLATNTFSHLSTSYWIIFPYPLSPALPIPLLALACPLTHPFLVFQPISRCLSVFISFMIYVYM